MTPSPSDAVAQPLHRMASVRLGSLADKRSQPVGELGAGFVAAFLGQSGVAREVEEGDRRRSPPLLGHLAELLEKLLRALDGYRKDLVLEVAAAEPNHEPLAEGHDPQAEVTGCVLHLLVRDAASEAREQRAARDVEIGCDNPANVLAIRACQAGEVVVVGLGPDRQELQKHRNVVVPKPCLRVRLRKTELAEKAADQLG
jgi:hypothetical protein